MGARTSSVACLTPLFQAGDMDNNFRFPGPGTQPDRIDAQEITDKQWRMFPLFFALDVG
jgi:hypothetical protein